MFKTIHDGIQQFIITNKETASRSYEIPDRDVYWEAMITQYVEHPRPKTSHDPTSLASESRKRDGPLLQRHYAKQ